MSRRNAYYLFHQNPPPVPYWPLLNYGGEAGGRGGGCRGDSNFQFSINKNISNFVIPPCRMLKEQRKNRLVSKGASIFEVLLRFRFFHSFFICTKTSNIGIYSIRTSLLIYKSNLVSSFYLLSKSNSQNLVRNPVQSANSGIGPFASQGLNLTQSIHKKVKTCNGKSGYI